VGSIVNMDSFISKHFELIFGRASYSDFHPIMIHADGFVVNGQLFRSKTLGDSG